MYTYSYLNGQTLAGYLVDKLNDTCTYEDYRMIQSKVSAILSKWSLSPEEREGLDKYFILYWESSYYLEHIAKTGKITREDIDYLTIYPHTSLLQIAEFPVVALSFRKFKSMSYGYVLVRPVTSAPDSKGLKEK